MRMESHGMRTAFDHRCGFDLKVEGAQVYCELAGREDGPALLMLHGGLGDIEDLNSIVADVGPDFRVIGIDSRGHGRSTLGDVPLTYELLQADVEQVLAHLGIRDVSIIGFSDGGVLGYRLAAHSGEGLVNVDQLVTIGASWRLEAGNPVVQVLAGITAEWWKAKFPESHAAYQRLNPQPDFERLAHLVVQMWLDTSASGYPGTAVESIACPTLVVRGQQDQLFPLEEAVRLVGLIEDSRLLNILSAGHAAFADRKEMFRGALLEFLSEEPVKGRSESKSMA
jgi:pimeloyl-ACP methyl ester carboxylesterase